MPKKKVRGAGIYRASIRISLNGDASSSLRGKLKKDAFEPNGFINDPGGHGTGAWINSNCTPREMELCIAALWKTANQHTGPGEIDHIWTNFEMIDLTSLFKSLRKEDRMSESLRAFLKEQGLEESPKKRKRV
ncbi:MAG: hypothetical protein R3D60_05515 [Paracoccaceae bacterium]